MMEDNDPQVQQLFKWAKDQGIIYSDAIRCGVFKSTGRGFYASRRITQDEVIIRLPQRLIFNVDAALNSELGPLFKQLIDQGVHEDTVLMIFTIHERFSANSLWAPYFAILPKEVDIGLTMPLDELLGLEGLPLMADIISAKEELQSYYDSVFPSLSEQLPQVFPATMYTFDNFLWARAIFESRGFSFSIGTTKNCLLPFVDMLNTSHYPQLDSKYEVSSNEFHIRTFGDCKEGEQLFINYGPYSNRELLLNYGFMITDNPYDRFRIDFEVPDDSFSDQKHQLLELHGLTLDHFLRKGPLSPRLLATLRICMLSEDKRLNDEDFNPFESLDADTELTIWNTFTDVITGLIVQLPDPENELSWSAQYVANQKDILVYSKAQAEQMQSTLRSLIKHK